MHQPCRAVEWYAAGVHEAAEPADVMFFKEAGEPRSGLRMFAAHYNYCWQTREPGKSGEKRPSAAMMAKLAGHVWSFEDLFDEVLNSAG